MENRESLKRAVDERLLLWLNHMHEVYFSKHIRLVLILITTRRMRQRGIKQSLNLVRRFTKHGVILGYVLQKKSTKGSGVIKTLKLETTVTSTLDEERCSVSRADRVSPRYSLERASFDLDVPDNV
jgi:hypothetical protein